MNKTGQAKLGIAAVIFVFVAIVVLSIIFGAFYNVGEGEVGVKFIKFGAEKGFQPNELAQGWGFKTPFRDRIITIPFRTQEISFSGESAITPKDVNGINYKVDVTVRYKLDPTQASEFIEQKGEGIPAMQQLMTTAIRADSTRGVFGQYAQEDVPQKRIELAGQMLDVLQERINKEATGKIKQGFIVVEAVDLRNVEFDPRIEQAIVTKQTQKQEAEKQEYNLQIAEKQKEIAIVNANRDKEAKILVAEGEGEAVLIVASAKAEGIQKVNDAYQGMPMEYVHVKYAESIRENDKIIFGLESLSGNSLNFLDVNEATGLVYKQQSTK